MAIVDHTIMDSGPFSNVYIGAVEEIRDGKLPASSLSNSKVLTPKGIKTSGMLISLCNRLTLIAILCEAYD